MYSIAVSPAMAITGALPFKARDMPPARFIVPGPEVVMHTDGFPVDLEYP